MVDDSIITGKIRTKKSKSSIARELFICTVAFFMQIFTNTIDFHKRFLLLSRNRPVPTWPGNWYIWRLDFVYVFSWRILTISCVFSCTHAHSKLACLAMNTFFMLFFFDTKHLHVVMSVKCLMCIHNEHSVVRSPCWMILVWSVGLFVLCTSLCVRNAQS